LAGALLLDEKSWQSAGEGRLPNPLGSTKPSSKHKMYGYVIFFEDRPFKEKFSILKIGNSFGKRTVLVFPV
jgi:hypothetical protein